MPFVLGATKTIRDLQQLCQGKDSISRTEIEAVFNARDSRKPKTRKSGVQSYMALFNDSNTGNSKFLSATDKVVLGITAEFQPASPSV